MRKVGFALLFTLALASMALALFGMGYQIWGLLSSIPIGYIMGGASFMLILGWMAYARWVWGVFSKRRGKRAAHINKRMHTYVAKPSPYIKDIRTMSQLEHDAHDQVLDGGPGSIAAASIALDAIDEYLD